MAGDEEESGGAGLRDAEGEVQETRLICATWRLAE